jgi:hypothetical protein
MQNAPIPDLRIVPVTCVHPHEEHDTQRSQPLMERIRQAELFTNPPIVSPMDDHNFVLLDGANRYHSFCHLGFQHILVQVAPYDSGFVELGVWQHVVSRWTAQEFLTHLKDLTEIQLRQGWVANAVAQILTSTGDVYGVMAAAATLEQRNAALRDVVRVYQKNAALHRTTMTDTLKIWQYFPDAAAIVLFPEYHPEDIIAAARHKAYLPPGISRHMLQGRALRLNYPIAEIKSTEKSLAAKNAELQEWLRHRLANRSVRYYAESTYQFDE